MLCKKGLESLYQLLECWIARNAKIFENREITQIQHAIQRLNILAAYKQIKAPKPQIQIREDEINRSGVWGLLMGPQQGLLYIFPILIL